MLYGVHVFARAKVIPDLAFPRGRGVRARPRDRRPALEFLSAGGTAMSYLELGDLDEATSWLDRAAGVVTESPTPARGRQQELWQGQARRARGDADGMRTHLERAVQMAADQGLPAARCEALAALALAAASLGAERDDEELDRSPNDPPTSAKELLRCCRATRRGARGPTRRWRPWRCPAGIWSGRPRRPDPRSRPSARRSTRTSNVDVLVPVANAIIAAGTDEERTGSLSYLRLQAAVIANRIVDEDIRRRWFRGPAGSALAALASIRRRRSCERPRTPPSSRRRFRRRGSAQAGGPGSVERGDRRAPRRRPHRDHAPPRVDVREHRRVLARRRDRFRVPGGDPVVLRASRSTARAASAPATASRSRPPRSTGTRATSGKRAWSMPRAWTRRLLREAALACPTQAIVLEEVAELLPWQLRGRLGDRAGSRRRSCSPTSSGRRTSWRRSATRRGSRCCVARRDAPRALRGAPGEEVVATGDGFFVGFDSARRRARLRGRDPAELAEHRQQRGFRAAGADRASRLGRHAGGPELHRARASTRPPGSRLSRTATRSSRVPRPRSAGSTRPGPAHRDR